MKNIYAIISQAWIRGSLLLGTLAASNCRIRRIKHSLSRAIVLILALSVPAWVYADSGSISFTDFSDPAGITLNLDAATAPSFDGTSTALRLVPDAYAKQGQAYLNCAIGMGDTTSFHSKFRFRIHGGQGNGGADGLAFVLHNDPAGSHAIGEGGPALGYAPTSPSVAIELDTYPFNPGDPGQKHVALLMNGSTDNHLATAFPLPIDLNDGNAHWLWVDYDGAANQLQVFLGDDEANKPVDPLFSYPIDIPGTLGGSGQAYFGITAATGGLWNAHDVEAWTLDITDSTGTVQKCASVPPVPNDEASTATALDPKITRTIATRDATGTDGEGNCAGSEHTVWYRYAADQTGTLRVSTYTSYPANFAVFTGTPGTLSQTACNPVNGDVQVEQGQTYYLMFGAQAGLWDNYGFLRVSADLLPPPPANDSFGNATMVGSLPFTDTVDITYANTAPDDPGCTNSNSVWYAFTPSRDMILAASTLGSWYPNFISVWTGAPGAWNPVLCGPEQVQFNAMAGTRYYFMIGSYWGIGGYLQFGLRELIPPANDAFASATTIGSLPFTDHIDTTDATPAADDPSCGWWGTGHSVWYRYTPTTSGRVWANTSQSSYAAFLSVWAGSPGAWFNIGCAGGQQLGFDVIAGNSYYLMVSSPYWWDIGGNLVLSVQEGLRLGVSYNKTGTVKRSSGLATISGTVTCNQLTTIQNLSGSLFQRAGRFTVIRGDFSTSFPNAQTLNPTCTPSNPLRWSVEVTGNGPFNSGSAEARASAYGCSQEQPDCVSMPQQATSIIQLKQTK